MPKDTAKGPRRSRGEGAITELHGDPTRPDRVTGYRGAIWLTRLDGTRIRRFVRGRTRSEVSRKFDALRKEAADGLPDGTTTARYLASWVTALGGRNLRPTTRAQYARHVSQYWTPTIGRVELAKLTPLHVEQAMAALTARGLSATTVRAARTTLRAALADAMRDGKARRNVAALVKPPQADRPEMRALTADEVGRLMEATRDDAYGPLFALAVASGLRLGELVGLRWTDVDMDGRKLTVNRAAYRRDDGSYDFAEPKTKRSRRTVMLPALAVEALRRQKARQAAARLAVGSAWQDTRELVFTDAVGRPVDPGHVSKAFRAAADNIGLTDVRFHDLRHTAATLMLTAGVPLKVVSEALGHVSIVITADTYAHVTPDLRREAADAMDRALGGGA
jgi:integrase